MELQDKIQEVYKASKNYPELVRGLIKINMQSYTVDVSSSTILYRFAGGNNILHQGEGNIRQIAEKFNSDETFKAIKDNQQGKTTYPEFMNGIAEAGVRFYEATLNGDNKRVTYIGSGGHYEETIPV